MNALGIQPLSLLAQVVNFLILFFVLKKLVFTKILESINKQKKQQQEIDNLQTKLRQSWSTIEQQKAKVLAAMTNKGNQEIAKLKETAEEQKNLLLAKARNQAKEIVSETGYRLANQKTAILKEVKQTAVDLTIQMTTALLKDVLDKKAQQKINKQALTILKGTKWQ